LVSSDETLTESGASSNSNSNSVPSEPVSAEEQVLQAELLRSGIERGVSYVEAASVEGAFAEMSSTEQVFIQLLDPLIWLMRESLISYEHADCEDCAARVNSGGNGLALAIAGMLLGDA
jgi:hypothetical protein